MHFVHKGTRRDYIVRRTGVSFVMNRVLLRNLLYLILEDQTRILHRKHRQSKSYNPLQKNTSLSNPSVLLLMLRLSLLDIVDRFEIVRRVTNVRTY